jgi:hypothetical protein
LPPASSVFRGARSRCCAVCSQSFSQLAETRSRPRTKDVEERQSQRVGVAAKEDSHGRQSERREAPGQKARSAGGAQHESRSRSQESRRGCPRNPWPRDFWRAGARCPRQSCTQSRWRSPGQGRTAAGGKALRNLIAATRPRPHTNGRLDRPPFLHSSCLPPRSAVSPAVVAPTYAHEIIANSFLTERM